MKQLFWLSLVFVFSPVESFSRGLADQPNWVILETLSIDGTEVNFQWEARTQREKPKEEELTLVTDGSEVIRVNASSAAVTRLRRSLQAALLVKEKPTTPPSPTHLKLSDGITSRSFSEDQILRTKVLLRIRGDLSLLRNGLLFKK
jgi:dihydrofolate reductase